MSIQKKQNIFIWFFVVAVQIYALFARKYLSNLAQDMIGICICLLIVNLPCIYYNLLIRKSEQPFADILNKGNMSILSAIGLGYLVSTPFKIFTLTVFSYPYMLFIEVLMLFFFSISCNLMLSNKALMIIEERIVKIEKGEMTDLDEIVLTLQPHIDSPENKIMKSERKILLGISLFWIIITVFIPVAIISSNLIFVSFLATFCFIGIIYCKLCAIYVNKLSWYAVNLQDIAHSKSTINLNHFKHAIKNSLSCNDSLFAMLLIGLILTYLSLFYFYQYIS